MSTIKETLLRVENKLDSIEKQITIESPLSPFKDIFTEKELSDYLGCSIATIQRRKKDGTLKPRKMGDRVYYLRHEVLSAIGGDDLKKMPIPTLHIPDDQEYLDLLSGFYLDKTGAIIIHIDGESFCDFSMHGRLEYDDSFLFAIYPYLPDLNFEQDQYKALYYNLDSTSDTRYFWNWYESGENKLIPLLTLEVKKEEVIKVKVNTHSLTIDTEHFQSLMTMYKKIEAKAVKTFKKFHKAKKKIK